MQSVKDMILSPLNPDPDLNYMVFDVNRMPYFKNVSVKKNRALKYFYMQGLLRLEDQKDPKDVHKDGKEILPVCVISEKDLDKVWHDDGQLYNFP